MSFQLIVAIILSPKKLDATFAAMPSQVGSTAGALFGIVLQQLLPQPWGIYPGVYALVGATSVLGGVFRASISLVVIMVEGTRGIEFLFGVIVAIVVSNWVTEASNRNQQGDPALPFLPFGSSSSSLFASP